MTSRALAGLPLTQSANLSRPMQVQWLIEVDVFPDTAKRITRVLDGRGQPWVRYHDDIGATELPSVDAPVIFWGSLGAAYTQRVSANWIPGAVGDVAQFECSAYFRGLEGIPIANADSVFTTVADLVANPAAIGRSLGEPKRVFVRPDSPLKPFSGRELAVSDITLDALDHGFYYEDEQLPIVVSTPKQVGREWRFVIADRQVVASSEYRASREGIGTNVPDAATELAAMVGAAEWQAAPLYVVDVGEVAGELRVMELNPFSGADLYHCDPGAVVDAANRVAARLSTHVV